MRVGRAEGDMSFDEFRWLMESRDHKGEIKSSQSQNHLSSHPQFQQKKEIVLTCLQLKPISDDQLNDYDQFLKLLRRGIEIYKISTTKSDKRVLKKISLSKNGQFLRWRKGGFKSGKISKFPLLDVNHIEIEVGYNNRFILVISNHQNHQSNNISPIHHDEKKKKKIKRLSSNNQSNEKNLVLEVESETERKWWIENLNLLLHELKSTSSTNQNQSSSSTNNQSNQSSNNQQTREEIFDLLYEKMSILDVDHSGLISPIEMGQILKNETRNLLGGGGNVMIDDGILEQILSQVCFCLF